MKITYETMTGRSRLIIDGTTVTMQDYNYAWKKYVNRGEFNIIKKYVIKLKSADEDVFSYLCKSKSNIVFDIDLFINVREYVFNNKVVNGRIRFDDKCGCKVSFPIKKLG